MAGKAIWEYRGDPERPSVLVQFSNGNIQNPENVNFTLYGNTNQTSAHSKKQRILAADTDRLSYVGNNFSTEAFKCNSVGRYFVGVLNKETGTMEVYDAERINMQPILDNTNLLEQSVDTTDQASRTHRERVDALIEAFGTNKQKRALSSRKMNRVGSEKLSQAMEKAAEVIIETKGTEELLKVAVNMEEYSQFLPKCNPNASKVEEVYKFSNLISPVDYAALETVSATFKNITQVELQDFKDKKKYGTFILQELQDLKQAKDIDRQVCSLFYLDLLIKLYNLKNVSRKALKNFQCPDELCGKLMKTFTVQVFKHDRVKNSISGTMQCKIVGYVIALGLHISDFQVDLTLLQKDLKCGENRIIEIAKAMGLKICKKMMLSEMGVDNGHKIGILSLPLTLYKPPAMAKRQRRT